VAGRASADAHHRAPALELSQSRREGPAGLGAAIENAEILAVHDAIFANAHVEERLERYIARLVVATREHKAVKKYGEASPRGARFLQMAATISAFRQGRVRPDELIYVAQEDVERYAVDVLAHRIFLKMAYRDESGKDVSPADVVQEVLERVHFD